MIELFQLHIQPTRVLQSAIFLLQQSMDNIYIEAVTSLVYPQQLPPIRKVHYQAASQTLVFVHPDCISLLTYLPKTTELHHRITSDPVPELEESRVVLVEWMVEGEVALLATEAGTLLTIDAQGEADIKAMNEDGLIAGSVGPSQEYVYLVTATHNLIQLNTDYDLVNQIPLDAAEAPVPGSITFTWRNDASHFSINYPTQLGRKAVTHDHMMAPFISPAKSDPAPDGLVQSVSEKGKKDMEEFVVWQPSGACLTGVDSVVKNNEKVKKIIFWEKNGLRHLEFDLPAIDSVKELHWSTDSSVLMVRVVSLEKEDQLLMFHRANYRWFLKDVLTLTPDQFVWPVGGTRTRQRLLIVGQKKTEVIEWTLRLGQQQWKSEAQQESNPRNFVYFVDGAVVHATDLSRGLMPPPMSMKQRNFGSVVLGTSQKDNSLFVVTLKKVFVWDIENDKIALQIQLGDSISERVFGLKLLSTQPLAIACGGNRYTESEGKLVKQEPDSSINRTYTYGEVSMGVTLTEGELIINSQTLTQECTSIAFYRQFCIFTVGTSQMYDKLFVVNMRLEPWLTEDSSNAKELLSEYVRKDTLNHRLVERGAKILGVVQGKVVFQLPRGNLEGILPKVIAIAQVQSYFSQRQYRRAFQTIRTHKLDFNLMTDIDPLQFEKDIENILTDIKREDYINLLATQTTEGLSSELKYVLPPPQLKSAEQQYEMHRKGNKIKQVCGLISNTLRGMGQDKYILSIFTSDIKAGKVKEVLVEIKGMRQEETVTEQVIPPHLSKEGKQKKKRTAQDILEYVCWLVDPQAVYEAALLTYDLELTSLAARCTQKDPKEYIPYLEGLKAIENPVEFKSKVCLDLKRYDIAVKELAQGNAEQIYESLVLIGKHKLFKHGLRVYSGRDEIKQVKDLIINELLATGETNQAYRMCQSIGEHQRALQISKQTMDSKKIKECLKVLYNEEEAKKEARSILELLEQGVSNRGQLARLYAFIENYEQAISIYLKHNDYAKAYKYVGKVSQQFRRESMREGFLLCWSVRRNELIKDRKEYLTKFERLGVVQRRKALTGEIGMGRARENEDMYSEVSMSSKAASSKWTMSTTTGMRKKKDKARSILTRNVKQGSPIEEEYLLAHLAQLQSRLPDAVRDSKLLIQHLICMDLVEEAEQLRDEVRHSLKVFKSYRATSFAQQRFEEEHPQTREIYTQENKNDALAIDSFNYLF